MTYKYIKQLPYCCVAACIEMILKKHNINTMSQEQIAYDLGLILPQHRREEVEPYFSNKKLLQFETKSQKEGFGTRVNKKEFSLSNFVKKNNLPFKVEIFSLEFYNLKEILENKQLNEDIILCFNYNKLYGKGNNGGHVSLFIEIKNDNIKLLDPSNEEPHIKEVNISKLFEAIKIHENGFGGIWKFTKIN